MELTRQADYAVRIILDLSNRPRHSVIRSDEIARRQMIPRAYFTKLVQGLARVGLVCTYRGARGGIRLARDPAAITLRQVIEVAQGPICLNRCLFAPGECPFDQICPVHMVWHHIQETLTRELDAVTFAHLRARQRWAEASSLTKGIRPPDRERFLAR